MDSADRATLAVTARGGRHTRRTTPRPWIFGIVAMPYGSFNGVVAVALPYLLRRNGASVSRIAAIAALVQAPAVWYILWAPVVDFGLRRRTWIVVLSLASATCAAAAFSLTTQPLRSITALLVAASVFNQPVSSALGALVGSVVPNAERGRAAGWSEAGILSAGVVAGGLTVWLLNRFSSAVIALSIGALIATPAAVALAVREPRSTHGSARAHVLAMVRELRSAITSPRTWLGIAFFLSPVGAGALMNLFAGVAPDFHASPNDVIAVAGLGGLAMATGALLGGVVLDRVSRWHVYPVAGLLTAASDAGIFLAPLRPISYVLGAATYAFCTGVGYAAFMALALELLGEEQAASGTRFTLFTAAVNVPVVYMLRLDGAAHGRFGIRGMIAMDGIANAAFAVVLLVALALVLPNVAARRRG